MANAGQSTGSMLLVEEYFASQDDRFVTELRQVTLPKSLAPFAEKWKRDPRPWAREQQVAYLRHPLDRPGHEPIVKRLFKHADVSSDDELMAEFLVTFDRLVRRLRRKRVHYDWQSRTQWEETVLKLPRNTIPHRKERIGRDPFTGKTTTLQPATVRNGRLFTHRTRYYLRRRAARYFRKLGHFQPDRYVVAVCRAMRLYTDLDLNQGEDLLECWGLLQIAYRDSPVLNFGPARVRVRDGQSLTNLQPAPRFALLWRAPPAGGELVSLLLASASRLIRQWATQMLRRDHALSLTGLDVETIFKLLNHAEEDVQQLGAELLLVSSQAAKLTLDEWLRLLDVTNPTILATICEALERHVAAERLSLAQCVLLATAAATPVARLGLRYLQGRTVTTPADRQAVVLLAESKCEAMAAAAAAWALQWFNTAESYDRNGVMPFLDSLSEGIRGASWRWMLQQSPAYHDPVVWARLTETPYDDIRANLVAALQTRAGLPGISADDLAPVWSSVLLNVHRGGRNKPKAAAQMVSAIVAKPERATALLPVLVVAVRSVRAPEMRSGLAAVMQLATQVPELVGAIGQLLPELELSTADSGARNGGARPFNNSAAGGTR